MKIHIIKLLVVMILILSFCLRVYKLDSSPASINWDEASLGYSAYSIMKTGKDEYGKYLPMSLRSFSDFKPALYAYFDIPFVYFGGLNQTTTRLVSVVAGTVSLLGVWWLLGIYVHDLRIRLVCLLLLSMEPWRLHYSRVALETNLSPSTTATDKPI